MNAGLSDVEAAVQGLVKPDGEFALVEANDKAIRDEWGRLVEIQSTGGDSTGLPQAGEKSDAEDKARYNRGEK